MLVNIHQAKTNLSMLLKKVSEGQDVIIARAGKPVARLVPYTDRPSKRVPGSARDKVLISPDFNDSLPADLLQEFENL
ncbi:MAG: type II toxin-antitoxin system Phd/YefM family antitoxin [Dethiobacter sp.]|nr:type II toxin-antitoxin system Phd/YefM family antitoxin [Dethiobacter sp.]